MAAEEYVGAIVFEVNSEEYEITQLTEDVKGDKKIVKTMNRKRRATGYVKIIPEITLKVTVPIPAKGEPDWLALKDGKITIEPVDGGDRVTYQDCFVLDMSAKYEVDKEASRDLTVGALNRIVEK